MGEILDEFSFVGGPRGKYPWDEWLDGRIHRLQRGEDFEPSAQTFRGPCHFAAKQRGGQVRTKCDGTESIVIQFFREAT